MHFAIRKHKTVLSLLKRKSVLGQHLAKGSPIFCFLQCGQAVALYPSRQRFHITSPFHTCGRTRTALRPGLMIVRNQPKFLLQLNANTGQSLFVIIRLDHGQFLGMYLVDRYVQMWVFRIIVHHGNPLVLTKPYRFANSPLNLRNIP